MNTVLSNQLRTNNSISLIWSHQPFKSNFSIGNMNMTGPNRRWGKFSPSPIFETNKITDNIDNFFARELQTIIKIRFFLLQFFYTFSLLYIFLDLDLVLFLFWIGVSARIGGRPIDSDVSILLSGHFSFCQKILLPCFISGFLAKKSVWYPFWRICH